MQTVPRSYPVPRPPSAILLALSPVLAACSACEEAAPDPGVTRSEATAPSEPDGDPVGRVAHERVEVAPPTLDAQRLAEYGLPYEVVEGEPMFELLEHDEIGSIDAPRFVRVEAALDWMDFDEPVLGVVGRDGTAKCYSAWMLDNHEIVNDELDGQAIAATW